MSVNKLIKFYIINANPSFSFNGNNLNSKLYSIFKSGFKNGTDFYKLQFKNKELFFDIKDFNEDFLFGICSVAEEIKPTSMILQRDKKTNIAVPYTLDSESRLEAYTFFYIDFKKCRMTTITNKKIQKVNEALCKLIDVYSNSTASVSILPEKNKNIKNTLEKLNTIKNIEVEFMSTPTPSEVNNVFIDMENDFIIEKYKLNLKINKTSPTFIQKLIGLKNSATEKNLSKINITGKNDYGIDEVVDLIENIYTKTVPLELTDDTVQNTEKVKENLKAALDEYF